MTQTGNSATALPYPRTLLSTPWSHSFEAASRSFSMIVSRVSRAITLLRLRPNARIPTSKRESEHERTLIPRKCAAILYAAYTSSHVPDGVHRALQHKDDAAQRAVYFGGWGVAGIMGTELKAATLAHIQVGLRRYNGTKINGNDKANLIE